MKPAWAYHETSCNHCLQPIAKSSKRLDDWIKTNDRFIRIHFHVECYLDKINRFFIENPFNPERAIGNNKLEGLDIAQKERRNRLLIRLNRLYAYYSDKINLQADISKQTKLDLERISNFFRRRDIIIKELEGLGGVPDNYKITGALKVQDLIKMANIDPETSISISDSTSANVSASINVN
jgi:hypothetical protein